MGVGTYGNDYSGAGRSIIVDYTPGSDEDHAAHVRERGSEAMDRVEYDQHEYDQANENLLVVVSAVCKEIGLVSTLRGRFGQAGVRFDRDVVGIAAGDVFEVGWRSWENDFIVAIGPASDDLRDFIASGGKDGLPYVVEEMGRGPAHLMADYAETLDAFEKLLRLSLLSNGFGTRVKTSSYTSRSDEAPADIDERIPGLVDEVRIGIRKLSRSADEALRALSTDERLEVAKVVIDDPEWNGERPPRILVPVYHVDEDAVALWDPSDYGGGAMVSTKYPVELRDLLKSLPSVGGLAPVPHSAETESFFSSMTDTRNGIRLGISAEQYSSLSSTPCAVSWEDGEDGRVVEVVLHGQGSFVFGDAPTQETMRLR